MIKKYDKYSGDIDSSEITPESVYLNRRVFMKGAAAATVAAAYPSIAYGARKKDELGDPANSFDQISSYNNFYEFSTDKQKVKELAKNFKTDPWRIRVTGLVKNPKTYDVDELVKKFTIEERIYRLRCVEAWSMVIPWQGFQLSELLKEVEPLPKAKYVKFVTLYAPAQMPGMSSKNYPWPYVEGLRLDEATNPLTLLATGLYGKPMPPQNGAPIRLVVPWKYGFKSIKSIERIELVDEMPTSLWMNQAPREYGFYANVNPTVDHPRWSQSSERRIGEFLRRKTLLFNGYIKKVAYMYRGMNMRRYF